MGIPPPRTGRRCPAKENFINWEQQAGFSTYISVNRSVVVGQQQQALNHVQCSVHGELVVVNRLRLTCGVVTNRSIDAESEMRVSHVLRPIEADRLTRMLPVEVNVAECLRDFVDLRLLGLAVEIERVRHVEMWIGDELIHYGVVDQQLSNHEQTLDLESEIFEPCESFNGKAFLRLCIR